MGIFSSKNQMPVDGKVRYRPILDALYNRQLTWVFATLTDCPGHRCLGRHGQERRPPACRQRSQCHNGLAKRPEARRVARRSQGTALPRKKAFLTITTVAPTDTEPRQAAAKDPDTQRFHYISADVSKPDYARELVAEAVAWNDGKALDVVWCVAGKSTPDFWVEAPLALTREQMDVNFWGSAEMAHAILREWTGPDAPVVPEPKHLVFTASVLAFFPIVGYGPYNTAKAALRALADTLVQELEIYPQKVKIHVVYPGSISSPGFERENLTKPEITRIIEEGDPVQTPDQVAAAAIRGLEKGQYSVTVAFLGSAMRWISLGGAPRDNWFIDTIMSWVMQIVWFFVLLDIFGKIRKFGKQHGHPSTYRKKLNTD
jgi:3-dehydrosphinganine reductase